MRQLKIALVLALAIILQSSLRVVWPPFVYVDLPLIVVVYFALQRDAMQALMVGFAAGLAADALGGGGLLGAGGFSMTLTAYLIVSLATRVMLDNPLARIPVLAGAALLNDTLYVLLHRMLGQTMNYRFVDREPLKLIATTVAGTIILYVLDQLFSERARQRRQLAFRRRVARRSPVRLGRRK
ncbi:MAG: rod shape-determining protein MreD [Blastocatellia bacterium]|jgi:rod shape-determining protein MreD|nr:rod shape-determining protein MreD [Blastocatellia bacterium]